MWWIGSASADCGAANLFAAADSADQVLAIEVVAPGRAVVREALKGPPATELVFRTQVGEDHEVPQAGRSYVVFVEGGFLASCTALLDAQDVGDRSSIRAVRDWLTLPDGHLDLLVREGLGDHDPLASDALERLGSSPALLARVTPGQRASLVARVGGPPPADRSSAALAWTLARLGAVEAVPSWVAWLERVPSSSSSTPVLGALAFLTNAPPPKWERGRDLYLDDLVSARAHYATWWAKWKDHPLDEARAAGPDGELAAMARRNACELANATPSTALSPWGVASDAQPCP